MSDLVQRLREYSNWGVSREAASMLSEAADEIERLTRELEEEKQKLRTAALESMARNADELGLDY